MLLSPARALAAFDVFFNALVDEYFSELILGGFDVELSGGLEGVLQSFVIVVEVEVEFGEQESDYGLVGEGGVGVELLTG